MGSIGDFIQLAAASPFPLASRSSDQCDTCLVAQLSYFSLWVCLLNFDNFFKSSKKCNIKKKIRKQRLWSVGGLCLRVWCNKTSIQWYWYLFCVHKGCPAPWASVSSFVRLYEVLQFAVGWVFFFCLFPWGTSDNIKVHNLVKWGHRAEWIQSRSHGRSVRPSHELKSNLFNGNQIYTVP